MLVLSLSVTYRTTKSATCSPGAVGTIGTYHGPLPNESVSPVLGVVASMSVRQSDTSCLIPENASSGEGASQLRDGNSAHQPDVLVVGQRTT